MRRKLLVRIGCGIGLMFVLAPAALLHAQPMRFAAIGDYGSTREGVGDVADLIATWNVDFVITMGDNRYGTNTYDAAVGGHYCAFLKDAGSGPNCGGDSAAVNAFFPSIGNHDYDDGGGITEYLGYFTLPGAGYTNSSGNERYYDFVWGDVHFFVVNSDDLEPDGITSTSTQAQWLQAQMSASTAPWQVVYFHHPAYSSSDVHGSEPDLQWPFADWGADAVLAGHDHTYERIFRDGIVYFVNGLGGQSIYTFGTPIAGSQARYNAAFGAMLMEADPDTLSFRFINVDGVEIDSYTLGRPPADTVVVRGGWNLIGLPLEVADAHVDSLFGDAAATAGYGYTAGVGYTTDSTLDHGKGYWILFGAADTLTVAGTPTTETSIPVAAGWNLVAGPGCAMPVADITTDPSGLVASSFYGYGAGGYFTEDSALTPWKGYWVLLDGPGTLTMSCP